MKSILTVINECSVPGSVSRRIIDEKVKVNTFLAYDNMKVLYIDTNIYNLLRGHVCG
jgi:hypothetical protein